MAKKYDIEFLQEYARNKGGELVDTVYLNSKTLMRWKCDKGHVWKAMATNILAGHWCHECGGSKSHTIEEMKALAIRKGGKCLSSQYHNNKTPLQWECKNGHTWWAIPHSIMRGRWCPDCSQHKKLTIEEMREIAESRGGKCLSEEYIQVKHKLKWQCSEGHTWMATPDAVKQGSWCPDCHYYLNEEKVRYIFEHLVGTTFTKTRKILGGNRELDGFNDKLKLAFEYHGSQHFKLNTKFHQNEQDFIKQQEKDNKKRKLCIEKSIILIEVPYWESENDERLIHFIQQKFIENHIEFDSKNFSFEDFYSSLSTLKKLKELAKSKGGRLLSNYFYGMHIKLEWECSEGHTWKAIPDSIIRGNWCRKCVGLEKLTIEMMKEIAISRDFTCLSDEYKNSNTKLEWECSKGHKWYATPHQVKNKKSGCPYCANQKVEDANSFGTNYPHLLIDWDFNKNELSPFEIIRGGKKKYDWICENGHHYKKTIIGKIQTPECPCCKSIGFLKPELITEWNYTKNTHINPYEMDCNSREKVWWECEKGHEWEERIFNRSSKMIKDCPICSSLQEKNKTLSDEWNYTKNSHVTPLDVTPGSHKKVWWKCDKGHEWEARINSRVVGNGCPYCSNHKVCESNCLATVNPRVALQWHPTKNGDLNPGHVLPGSGQRVWWQCEKGHEWMATINNRNKGTGCPECRKNRY